MKFWSIPVLKTLSLAAAIGTASAGAAEVTLLSTGAGSELQIKSGSGALSGFKVGRYLETLDEGYVAGSGAAAQAAERALGGLASALAHCYDNRGSHDSLRYGPGVTCYSLSAEELIRKIHAAQAHDAGMAALRVLGALSHKQERSWAQRPVLDQLDLAPLRIFGLIGLECQPAGRDSSAFCVIRHDETEMARAR